MDYFSLKTVKETYHKRLFHQPQSIPELSLSRKSENNVIVIIDVIEMIELDLQ
jgi:hypothetical protein